MESVQETEGYAIHFLKIVEATPSDVGMKRIGLKLEQTIIPSRFKDSFENFIKSIGSKVPDENELKEWHSSQLLIEENMSINK